jgi:hypothetical protein
LTAVNFALAAAFLTLPCCFLPAEAVLSALAAAQLSSAQLEAVLLAFASVL